MSEQIEPQSTIVMSHIADIKEKLATNTADTKNASSILTKIESQLTDFSKSFVTHDEFKGTKDTANDHEVRIRSMESKVWRAIGALVICQIVILPVLMFLFFKSQN